MTIRLHSWLLAVGGAAAMWGCSHASDTQIAGGVGHVHISLTGGADTIGFQVPMRARRCGDGRGVVLDGELRGNGLLIWLRDGNRPPNAGSYSLLSRGDSAAPRGAIASVRYVLGTVAHGLIIDSGSAVLTAQTPYAVRIDGNGAEAAMSGRRAVTMTADRVSLERDTVNCTVQL